MIGKDFFNPQITKVVRCSTCREIIAFERENCPYCGIKINHEELRQEAEQTHKLIQSISVANSISISNLALTLYVVYSISFYYQQTSIVYGVIIAIIGMVPPLPYFQVVCTFWVIEID